MWKALGAITVLTALGGGCGSSDPEPTASAPSEPAPRTYEEEIRAYYGDGHAEEGDVEAEYHQPPHPAEGKVGDTITLTGSNIGVRMRVTVTRVADVARASRPAGAGQRYVGVHLRLRSTGITILEGQLGNAELDYDGGTATRAEGVRAACSNGFHEPVRIEVGNSATGCVLFAVPEASTPQTLRFALEQVPAEVGGRWTL